MRRLSLLGSTGSIGTQTLDVVRPRRGQFGVVALAAGGAQPEALAAQVAEFAPQLVAVADEAAVDPLGRALAAAGVAAPRIVAGEAGILEAATVDCDVVLNAITGSAGLRATLATLAAGRRLALANKESLVIGGRLVTDAAAPGQIVAVDSEHSALAQCLRAGRADEVRRLILTCSGGPFRGWSREAMRPVTPAQAMAHPTWTMGRVITINSATLVNKGLELIEATLLYGVSYDQVQVVVHPQSVIHSAVEFIDGATIAQASPPDMRLAISLALDWPRRLADAAAANDWSAPVSWTFEPLDDAAFPAVELARRCGALGGTVPAVYNAANEACVDAFCAGRIGFLDIVDTIAAVVAEHVAQAGVTAPRLGWTRVDDAHTTLEAVLAADAWARARADAITTKGRS